LRILIVHPSGAFGGASKSIIEFQNYLRNLSVTTDVLCVSGNVVGQFRSNGYLTNFSRHLSQFDNTRFGYYRGFRWLITLRELVFFPSSLKAIKGCINHGDYCVIHINEITLIPWVKLIRRWTNVPIIIHVRSLQRQGISDYRTRWLNSVLMHDVDKVIAIDDTVRRTLPKCLPVTVIHNSMKIEAQKNCGFKTRARFRIAIIGVLLKLKGIYEFLEAARILVRERGYDIEFYIVGENARELSGLKAAILKWLDLAHDVRSDTEAFVAAHSLQEHIVLTGFIENVQSIYADLDVLCFPSHLNAAGRPVFEAAFYGVPSIVAVKDPPPDTIIHGETGICIDEPDGRLIANAIERLFKNREELEFLGRNAKRLAHQNFDIKKNAEALLQVYKDAISKK